MSSLFPVAGCKIYIGGVKATKNADFVEADFAGEAWTEIDGWSQMGAIGDTAATITTSLINRGRDVKQKGTANAGQMQNVFAIVPGDPGQAKLTGAAKPSDKNNYAIRIDLNDAQGGAPSKRLFIGLVMTDEESGGEANTIQNINATLEINSNIVKVPRT